MAHVPYERNTIHGGTQRLYRFPNGYGASVVHHAYSYGQEMAVLKFDGDEWDLTYETPITNDVIGHLSDGEVERLLDRIKALPAEAAKD